VAEAMTPPLDWYERRCAWYAERLAVAVAALRAMCSLVAGTSAEDEQPYRDALDVIAKVENP
jgi:hypothetical protein